MSMKPPRGICPLCHKIHAVGHCDDRPGMAVGSRIQELTAAETKRREDIRHCLQVLLDARKACEKDSVADTIRRDVLTCACNDIRAKFPECFT